LFRNQARPPPARVSESRSWADNIEVECGTNPKDPQSKPDDSDEPFHCIKSNEDVTGSGVWIYLSTAALSLAVLILTVILVIKKNAINTSGGDYMERGAMKNTGDGDLLAKGAKKNIFTIFKKG
jgi:hypothetical protein